MNREAVKTWMANAAFAVFVVLVIVGAILAVVFGVLWLSGVDVQRAQERCVEDAIQTLVYTGELDYSAAVELLEEFEEVLCP